MNDTLQGRLEHALFAVVLVLVLLAARWALAQACPEGLKRAFVPARLRMVLFGLILVPPLVLLGAHLPRLFGTTTAGNDTTSVEAQMAASRAAPGWHVVGGELFHDGQRDEEGTRRMQEAIAAVNVREQDADGMVDHWAAQRKDALGIGFQAQRNAVYWQYERGGRN